MLVQHPEIAPTFTKEIHFWNARYHQGLDWYKGLFESPKIQGDITPAYAIIPPQKTKECYQHFPDLKIIYVLRDPIERIWSAFLMELGRSGHNKTRYPNKDTIRQFITRRDTIARSMYYDCYMNWSHVYPAENFLLLHFEDIATHPEKLLYHCFNFLGVDTSMIEYIKDIHKKKRARTINIDIHPMVREMAPPEMQQQWELIQPLITRMRAND